MENKPDRTFSVSTLDICNTIIICNTEFINFNTKLIDFNENRYRSLGQKSSSAAVDLTFAGLIACVNPAGVSISSCSHMCWRYFEPSGQPGGSGVRPAAASS